MLTVERTLQERLRLYQETRRKGVEFLLAQQNDDGSVSPVEHGVGYYRVPWALALAGETGSAMAKIAWIRRHALTADGELRGPFPPAPGANRTVNTYAETCLAYGAQLLRQFDVARRAMAFALRFQDPETGGVYMDRDRTGPDAPQILFLTCQLGMSAVMTGHLEAALRAGRWLRRLWDAQPDLPDSLYTIWTRGGGLMTQLTDGIDPRHIVARSQEVRQMHYNGGIAAAFLAQLHLATDDPSWLDLARAYQRFSMESTPRQFETKQVCKSAWGGGLLSLITHEPTYLDWVVRMGDWFAAEQAPDGHWQNSAYINPDPPLHQNIEITAEFVVHLDTVISAVGVRR